MLAISAVSAIKQGVAIYKDAKNVGKEVYGIYSELSEGVGNFFDHQENAHKELKEKEKNPPKGKSIKAQALENVIKKKQLQQAEYDLRQMLVYESPPELGSVWTEFEAERTRLVKEQEALDKAQKKRNCSNHTKGVYEQETSKWELQSVSLFSLLRLPLAV